MSRTTLRSILDRYGDVGLAAGMAVTAIAEAIGDSSGSGSREPVLTLLFTVPLAWRRRWPMAIMLVVFFGIAVSRQAPYVEVAAQRSPPIPSALTQPAACQG